MSKSVHLSVIKRLTNVRKNLNIENVKSYSADGYSESNVPGNAIDDKMDTGNGRNWNCTGSLNILDTELFRENLE